MMNNENVEEPRGNSSGSDGDAENLEGSSSDSDNSHQEDVSEGNHSESIIDNTSGASYSSDDFPPPNQREEKMVPMSESDDSDHSVGEPLYWTNDGGPFIGVEVEVIPRLHEFETPSRKIRTYDDMQPFHEWEEMQNFFGFIVALTRSVQGTALHPVEYVSGNIKNILRVLNEISSWIDEEMPEGPNESETTCRKWQLRLYNGVNLMNHVVTDHRRGAANEIFFYFVRGFGSLNDVAAYGLHHELMFIAWLYCLARLRAVEVGDYPAVVAKLMLRYHDIIKKLKDTFTAIRRVQNIGNSPSGDDFVTYIFGSSQLIGSEDTLPPICLEHRNAISLFATRSIFFQLVWERSEGGRKRIPLNIFRLGRENGWKEITEGLLKDYRGMLGDLRVLKKLKSGSLIQLI